MNRKRRYEQIPVTIFAVLLLVAIFLAPIEADEEMVGLSAFRPNLEAADFVVSWDISNRQAVGTGKNIEARVSPGSKILRIDELEIEMKRAAELTDGHIYIPSEDIERIIAADRASQETTSPR